MKIINEIFLMAATGIMAYNIYTFIKFAKARKTVLIECRKRLTVFIKFYLILLCSFLLGYIGELILLFLNKMPENLSILLVQILFWGSVFVLISIQFTKALTVTIYEEKLNATDSMTGLYNKTSGSKNMIREMENNNRVSLLMIDLDNFKNVNDIYGHMVGDEVIKAMATIIRNSVKGTDICSHFGGDEFVALIKTDDDINEDKKIAQTIIDEISKLCFNYKDAKISCSIGIARSIFSTTTYQELFLQADRALYTAKKEGKGRYHLFTEY